MPKCANFPSRMLWSTQSKAFFRSRKIIPFKRPLSIFIYHLLVICNNDVWVELFFLNPESWIPEFLCIQIRVYYRSFLFLTNLFSSFLASLSDLCIRSDPIFIAFFLRKSLLYILFFISVVNQNSGFALALCFFN